MYKHNDYIEVECSKCYIRETIHWQDAKDNHLCVYCLAHPKLSSKDLLKRKVDILPFMTIKKALEVMRCALVYLMEKGE